MKYLAIARGYPNTLGPMDTYTFSNIIEAESIDKAREKATYIINWTVVAVLSVEQYPRVAKATEEQP